MDIETLKNIIRQYVSRLNGNISEQDFYESSCILFDYVNRYINLNKERLRSKWFQDSLRKIGR